MASRITGTSGVFRLEPQATLTSRERLILQGLWSGKNTSQISEEFGFSMNAVNALRHQLRQKYQASNVAQLVRIALAHGDLSVI